MKDEDRKVWLPVSGLSLGDRFVIEPAEGEDFEAVLIGHNGWGLVHGEVVLLCRRDDGREFTYGIQVKTPVRMKRHTHRNGVVETDGSGPNDATCGGCGRSWDDSVGTGITPTPSARCPFEYEHEEADRG